MMYFLLALVLEAIHASGARIKLGKEAVFCKDRLVIAAAHGYMYTRYLP